VRGVTLLSWMPNSTLVKGKGDRCHAIKVEANVAEN
jgi:hypothetical protein